MTALPPGALDARDFQQIVDETKRRIPKHCPEWTNHNLSDPGVALIELFAWMTESILYRLDQVPERYYSKFLELVGVEPFGPAVAQAELTFYLSTFLDQAVTVKAGTAVATSPLTDAEPVVFTTVEDLVVKPPLLKGAMTSRVNSDEQYIDVWDELRYEDGVVTCFPSSFAEGQPVGDALYLAFEDSLAGSFLHLAANITGPASGVGVDPKHPPLVWEVWTGETWEKAARHGDTTGGLNQTGEVVLMIPRRHESTTLGGLHAFWLRAVLSRAAKDQPTYKASPQIKSIAAHCLGGTVTAEHAEIIGRETLGRSDGTPGQAFTVSRPPVLAPHDHERVQVVTLDGVDTEWERHDDFTASTENDKHYTWDGATGVVRFGPRVQYADGDARQHGAIPRDGAEIVATGYRHGGGSRGNVGAETLIAPRDSPSFVDRVTNLTPAIGGVDAETIENAKLRGPMTIRTGSRAVTAADFERIAREASADVWRAKCLPPEQPGMPIRVLLVPDVRDDPPPDLQTIDDFALSPRLVKAVKDELDERRLLGSRIEIGTPYYQGVTVAALLRAKAGRQAIVNKLALEMLYNYINPVTGGADGAGWPFAGDRQSADISAATIAQMLEGLDVGVRVEHVLLFEYDLRIDDAHTARLVSGPGGPAEGVPAGPARDVIRLDPDSLFLSAKHRVVVR